MQIFSAPSNSLSLEIFRLKDVAIRFHLKRCFVNLLMTLKMMTTLEKQRRTPQSCGHQVSQSSRLRSLFFLSQIFCWKRFYWPRTPINLSLHPHFAPKL